MITYVLVGAAALATAVVVITAAAGLAFGISKVKSRPGVKIGPITYADYKRRRDRKKTGKDKKKNNVVSDSAMAA